MIIDSIKTIVKTVEDKEQKKTLRNAYYDTLMMVYTNWMKVYPGKEVSAYSYMGLYTYVYQNDIKAKWHDAKKYFEKSIELGGNKTSYQTVSFYLSQLQRMCKYKELDTATWIDAYFKVSDIVDFNLSEGGKYQDKWQKTREDIDAMMEPVLQCDQLIPIYDQKLEKGGLTPEELNKMVTLLKRKGCGESETYRKAAITLCDLKPTDACKEFLGDEVYKEGKYSEAQQYYKEAIELAEDNARKSDLNLKMADCALKGGGGSAASYVNTAISLNPNNGKAYMLKASLYLSTLKNCGDAFDKACGYIAVVDLYNKAKSVDPTVADACNSKIATYSKYYPKCGEVFFKTMKEGDSYTVNCLGVTVTIKCIKE